MSNRAKITAISTDLRALQTRLDQVGPAVPSLNGKILIARASELGAAANRTLAKALALGVDVVVEHRSAVR